MKKILLTILFIAISSKMLACTCMIQKVIDRYAKSDFVATVNVLNIDSEKDDNYLNLQIEILELYKGNQTDLLKIPKSRGTCGIYTPENTKWLIFASKDKNGNLTFGYCSGAKQIDKKFDSKRLKKNPNVEIKHKRNLERKIELLQYLKREKIRPQNEFGLHSSFSLESMKKLKGYDVNKERFALYELTVDKDLSVLNVKELKAFDNEKLAEELLEFIRENISIGRKGKLNEIPERTKIVLGLYYYPSENKNLSFVGTFAL
jgi:hypothetical protein